MRNRMGSTYNYTCTGCGYSANVSGGRDVGFVVKIQTRFCTTCDELVDCVTEIWAGDGEIERSVVIGACHKCKTQVTQDWNEGDPCPRCNAEFGAPSLYCDWD